MADQAVIELFKKAFLNCLEETFERVSGIYLDGGTSLFETLDGVSAEEASRSSPGGGATLAAQVEHVSFYLDVLNEVMQKQVVPRIDWREIWNRVREVTPEEWEDKKRGLRQSYQRVVETVTGYEQWQSEYGISGSLAILAHSAFHLGGIRQVLRAIRPVPSLP